MKKIFYLALFVTAASVSANAQTEKGYMMVGSQFANLRADKAAFSVGINPDVAWFIKDNLALGASVMLGYSKPKNVDGTFSYGLAPMARLYFAGNEKNKFFGQARVGFGGASQDGNSTSYWQAGIMAGYNYFVVKNVALELGAGYDHTKAKDVDGVGGFGVNFGLQVFLPTKRVK